MNHESSLHDWPYLSEEALSGMADWRTQHPQASLSEIEREVDARLSKLRARIIQDAAQASTATSWNKQAENEAPSCPHCGELMRAAGRHHRHLQTSQGQQIALERSYAVCPACGYSFFPPR